MFSTLYIHVSWWLLVHIIVSAACENPTSQSFLMPVEIFQCSSESYLYNNNTFLSNVTVNVSTFTRATGAVHLTLNNNTFTGSNYLMIVGSSDVLGDYRLGVTVINCTFENTSWIVQGSFPRFSTIILQDNQLTQYGQNQFTILNLNYDGTTRYSLCLAVLLQFTLSGSSLVMLRRNVITACQPNTATQRRCTIFMQGLSLDHSACKMEENVLVSSQTSLSSTISFGIRIHSSVSLTLSSWIVQRNHMTSISQESHGFDNYQATWSLSRSSFVFLMNTIICRSSGTASAHAFLFVQQSITATDTQFVVGDNHIFTTATSTSYIISLYQASLYLVNSSWVISRNYAASNTSQGLLYTVSPNVISMSGVSNLTFEGNNLISTGTVLVSLGSLLAGQGTVFIGCNILNRAQLRTQGQLMSRQTNFLGSSVMTYITTNCSSSLSGSATHTNWSSRSDGTWNTSFSLSASRSDDGSNSLTVSPSTGSVGAVTTSRTAFGSVTRNTTSLSSASISNRHINEYLPTHTNSNSPMSMTSSRAAPFRRRATSPVPQITISSTLSRMFTSSISLLPLLTQTAISPASATHSTRSNPLTPSFDFCATLNGDVALSSCSLLSRAMSVFPPEVVVPGAMMESTVSSMCAITTLRKRRGNALTHLRLAFDFQRDLDPLVLRNQSRSPIIVLSSRSSDIFSTLSWTIVASRSLAVQVSVSADINPSTKHSLFLEFSNESFWCKPPYPLGGEFTLSVSLSADVDALVSQSVVDAISQTTVATSSLGAALGNPNVALVQARLGSLMELLDCNFVMFDVANPTDSPTGFGFGSAYGRYYRGAIAGNLILFVSLVLMLLAATVTCYVLRRVFQAKKFEHFSVVELFLYVSADLRSPGIITVPVSLCFQGTISAAVTVLTHPHDNGDIALAIGGLLVSALSLAYVVLTLTFRFNCELMPCSSDAVREDMNPLRRYFFYSDVHWVPKKTTADEAAAVISHDKVDTIDNAEGVASVAEDTKKEVLRTTPVYVDRGWKYRHFVLFTDYRQTFPTIVEFCTSFLLGVVDGIRVSNRTVCYIQITVFILSFVVLLVLGLLFWPWRTRSTAVYFIVIGVIGLSSAILLVASYIFTEASGALATGNQVLSLAGMLLSVVKVFIDVLNGITSLITRHCCKNLRREKFVNSPTGSHECFITNMDTDCEEQLLTLPVTEDVAEADDVFAEQVVGSDADSTTSTLAQAVAPWNAKGEEDHRLDADSNPVPALLLRLHTYSTGMLLSSSIPESTTNLRPSRPSPIDRNTNHVDESGDDLVWNHQMERLLGRSAAIGPTIEPTHQAVSSSNVRSSFDKLVRRVSTVRRNTEGLTELPHKRERDAPEIEL